VLAWSDPDRGIYSIFSWPAIPIGTRAFLPHYRAAYAPIERAVLGDHLLEALLTRRDRTRRLGRRDSNHRISKSEFIKSFERLVGDKAAIDAAFQSPERGL
jgi:hypothetical protein